MRRSPCCVPPRGRKAEKSRVFARRVTLANVPITLRKATLADIPQIEALIARSARGLSAEDYRPAQIEGALRGAFGVDTQLLADQTYFVAVETDRIAGCGGWSFRSTLFGGDARAGRDSSMLDPRTQAAKIRAFFVDPADARRGIGTLLLERCENEARARGFSRVELMATLPGVKLYAARGYLGAPMVRFDVGQGESIEFIPMHKVLIAP
jgi:GNAT superfamily N-acetyltransferase